MDKLVVPDTIIFNFDVLIELYKDKDKKFDRLKKILENFYIGYIPIEKKEDKDAYSIWEDAYNLTDKLYTLKSSDGEINKRDVLSLNKEAERRVAGFEKRLVKSKGIKNINCRVLEDLCDRGIKLGVVSTYNLRVVKEFLERNEIDMYFKGIYGRKFPFNPDEIKINANLILAAIDDMKVNGSNIWYVGNSIIDIYAARDINVCPVGISSLYHSEESLKFAGASFVFDDLNELSGASSLLAFIDGKKF